MFKRMFFMLGLMTALVSYSAQAAVETNELAPDFTLTDTNGKAHKLSDYKGKIVVLEWVNFECPFVKKHYQSGNMQSLQKDMTAKDVVWLSINSSAEGKQGYYQAAEVNEIMMNSNASPTAYLLDTNGEVGHLYGAQTTPHMFIIDPQGTLIYQGAIDNKPTFDLNDIPSAKNFVLLALNAAMTGEKVEDTTTAPYGCSVKY
ncbi:MAG TPA: thioredoxin family protein [Candidatus Omnitrophota bacterium]|nr:thioredoxin family protein [Candidatus Omnitrophota bacterium]